MIAALSFRLAVARHDTARHADRALLWFAARLPHRLIMWTVTHAVAATTRPHEVVSDVRAMDVLKRWGERDLYGRAAARHRRP